MGERRWQGYSWQKEQKIQGPEIGKRLLCYRNCKQSGAAGTRTGEHSSLVLFKTLLLIQDCKASQRRKEKKECWKAGETANTYLTSSPTFPQTLSYIHPSPIPHTHPWQLWEGKNSPYFKASSSRIPSWKGKSSTKVEKWALAGVAQWIECWPAKSKGPQFDSQPRAPAWVAGQVPSRGYTRGFSPSLPPSLPLSKINK